MSDKVQLIKQEIERRIESMNSCPFKTAELGSEKFNEGELYAYRQILQFIDSLDSLPEEPASEDLIEEIDKIWKTCNPIDEGMGVETANIHIEQFDDIARHFAEWQEKKMLGIAEAFYQQGRYEQEQEMMKDAVELHIVESFNPVGTENEKPHGFTALCYNAEYPDFYPVTGQTIKFIPIKEIQQ